MILTDSLNLLANYFKKNPLALNIQLDSSGAEQVEKTHMLIKLLPKLHFFAF